MSHEFLALNQKLKFFMLHRGSEFLARKMHATLSRFPLQKSLTALALSWFMVVHGVFISLIARDWKKYNAQITVHLVKITARYLRMG